MKNPIAQSRQAVRASSSALFAIALSVTLAGCNVGPKYVPPTMTAPPAFKESPTQFKETEGWTVAQPQDAALHGKWWEIYNDPELNALEEQLNIDNQNIRVSFENFMEARALVREARSQLFPTISIGPSYTRSQTSSTVGSSTNSGSGTGTSTSSSGRQSQIFALPADVSWEPDLWGKVRNTIRANQYNAQLSAADLENERLSEQASLAEYFFEIRGQDELQRILDATVDADKKAVDSERARYDTGVDDQISLVEAQTTLESAQSAATNLGIARAQYEHAIAMLVGKPASSFSIPVKASTTAPPPIPIGLPSQLLERRPDILAAQHTFNAAFHLVQAAQAARLPSFALNGAGGYLTNEIYQDLKFRPWVWTAGADLLAPLYTGGYLQAQVKIANQNQKAALALYGQTLLQAFDDVEVTLTNERYLKDQEKDAAEALKSTEDALNLGKVKYDVGQTDLSPVLQLESVVLATQTAETYLRYELIANRIDLYLALGGPF